MRNYLNEINANCRSTVAIGGMSSSCDSRIDIRIDSRIGRSAGRIYNPARIDLISSLKNQNKLFCAMLSKWRHATSLKNFTSSFRNLSKEEVLIGLLTVSNLLVSGFLVFV